MEVARSELKAWARENMKGIENCIFPSFTPDLRQLDEDGIRWDVQMSIKHGFTSTLVTTETGLTFEEAKRLLAIVADEAKGKINVSTTVLFDSFEENIEFLKHAEKVGAHCAMIGYPTTFYPHSEDEIFEATKAMCDASNLAIMAYATHKYNFERLHCSGFPLGLLRRIAEIDSVVAFKAAILEPGFLYEIFNRCGDLVLVQCPWDRWLPILISQYHQQCMGAGAYEAFQSPEKPYLTKMFDLMLKGQWDEAMDIYWMLTPARLVFEKQFMPTQQIGTYHWPQQKYYQWLVGGNGGWTRQPSMKLYQHDMEESKNALRAIGITPREPDDEFYVGRLNYAKMHRREV